MPKHFDPTQRNIIHQKLLEAGRDCWEHFGIRRTRVDDLAKAAGISKGTFYSFFPCKELLFMEILESSHNEIKTQLIASLSTHAGSPQQRFTHALIQTYRETRNHPWLVRLLKDKDEYTHLVRSLPPEKVDFHIGGDDWDTEQLLGALGVDAEQVDVKSISAALRALFTMLLHESEIGPDQMDAAFELLLKGLASQIFGGSAHD